MRILLILVCAALLILGAFALHPGVGILVALLTYGAVDGLLRQPKKKTADERARADRRAMGYDK